MPNVFSDKEVPFCTREDEGHIGVIVFCAKCNNRKAPYGRSIPLEIGSISGMCMEQYCTGYWNAPMPTQLWQGETCKEFGYVIHRRSPHGN